MRSAAVRSAAQRIALLRVLCLVGFLVLAARAAHLTVVDKRGLDKHGDQVGTYIDLHPGRGVVYDRNGSELAVTVQVPSVVVIPREVEDVDVTVRGIANALDMPRSQVAQRLAGRRQYTFVARWVTAEQAHRIEDLGLPGVRVQPEPRRIYPHKALAGQLIGFANIDGAGAQAIEQHEDAWLRGRSMRVRVQRDARGGLHTRDAIDEPSAHLGGDLLLTLDARMQAAAEAELRAAVESSLASGGVALTLDPSSGEILALAEAPGFDPNEFRRTPYANSRARSIVDAVEPGSTMKAFLVAIALEAGVIDESDVFETADGWIRVRGKTIKDHRPYGDLDPAGILRVSSNVGAVLIAQELGREPYYAGLHRFGFGTRTGIGFPSESAGILRRWENWKPVDHANLAFGQGISVTAVQLAAAMGALADGGTWHRPHLVKARREPGGSWIPEPPGPTRAAVSPETARTVLRMMESVVTGSGTGRRAGLRGVGVAGKTGTAQKYDAHEKSYSRDRYIAWFMGAVPADDPRLVILVGLDEPRTEAHGGGDVSAPAFAAIAAAQLAWLGIMTEPEPIPAVRRPPETVIARTAPSAARDDVARSEALPRVSAPPPAPTVRTRSEAAVFLPDFTGLSVNEVLQISRADALDLELELVGQGHAVGQQPAAGSVIVGRDRRVTVRFQTASARRRGEG